MNVNEYGVVFGFFTAFDMSGYSSISIAFTKPDGTTLVVTNPDVSVPNVPFVTPGPTFPAKQYAQYTFVEGDVTQPGTWTARVTYETTSPPVLLTSAVGSFTVNP